MRAESMSKGDLIDALDSLAGETERVIAERDQLRRDLSEARREYEGPMAEEIERLKAHVAALETKTQERCALYLDMLARHHPHLAEAYRHAATNLRAQTPATLAMMDALPLPSARTDLDATR